MLCACCVCSVLCVLSEHALNRRCAPCPGRRRKHRTYAHTHTQHTRTRTRAPQALCFLSGANSIFDGDKLLTTSNNDRNEDLAMFEELGLTSRPAFMPYGAGGASSAHGSEAAAAAA